MTSGAVQQSSGYSGEVLLVATGGALLAGLSLGYLAGKRALRGDGRRSPSLLNLSGYRNTSAEGFNSGLTTPCMTPRTGSSENLAGEAAAQTVKMAVIVRQDVPMAASRVVQHAAWTVLGMFKKLYRRRDPLLKTWDVDGEKLEVLLAPSEDELMAVQAAARARGLPTHTFAGRDRSRKQRSVMAVGPADSDTLQQVVGHLKDL